MTKTVTALYDSYEDAAKAVSALEAAGVPHADISIVANDAEGRHKNADTTNTASDAGTGAGIGAVAGGGLGLLAGLGIMAIPGVGPVVAAGWLVATAAGAVAGAIAGGATGGIIGALKEAGVPEDDAHVYAEGVRRGGSLVTARVSDERAGEAKDVLQRSRLVDIGARRSAYRAKGWSRFDEDAAVYTQDEIRRDRSLYS